MALAWLETVILWLAIIDTLLLAVTAAEVALGFLVLQRAGDTAAGRFLGAFLILQFFAFGLLLLPVAIHDGNVAFFGYLGDALPATQTPNLVGLVALGFVGATLASFAMSYPSLAHSVQRRPLLLGLPYVLPTIMMLLVVVWSVLTWRPGAEGHLESVSLATAAFALLYELAATLFAAVVFHLRRRRANTGLEAQRSRYMLRAVAIPSMVALVPFALAILALLATGPVEVELGPENVGTFIVAAGLVELFLAALVLVPAIAMGFGLLRYRILDWDDRVRTGLRFTVQGGFLAGVFLLLAFLISEGLELFVASRTGSQAIGIVAAGLFTFALRPVQRLASRLARRTVPKETLSEGDRRLRRRLIYRAAFEELSSDEVVTRRERTALASLARSLQMSLDEAKGVESDVAVERGRRAA